MWRRRGEAMIANSKLAHRMSRVTPSAIMETLKVTAGGGFISFASGLPDPDLFPIDDIKAITDDILTTDGRAALQYGPAEGYPLLRELVADRLKQRQLNAKAENILITHGSQQSLDLAARAFLDPGDLVCLESPSYLAAIQAFDSYEVDYLPLPIDEQGLDPDRLASAPETRTPKMLFTLPTFQNPTGITMTLERRQRIAEIAAAAQLPVLEDDAYYDLRYDGEPLPPIAALADNPWAMYTGTFSKTIVPGIRVGWIYAHPDIIVKLGQLKQITDLHSSSLSQRIAYRFCASGKLEPQIRFLCDTYRQKRDLMLRLLDGGLPSNISRTHPQGGMFLLLTLEEDADAQRVLARALERKIAFIPGGSFFPDGRGQNTIRLNFVSSKPEEIENGIPTLMELL